MANQQGNPGRSSGYEHSDPFDAGYLAVSELHRLHYEQYGSPEGKPVVFLHGGPGGQTSKANTQYFNPAVYRVVLFDQRGAGKSQPCAELRDNTSQLLVEDIETLRRHLGIRKWHAVLGGSWGSALALLYAQTHPDAVGSLVLRGVFTARRSELAWSRGENGARNIYPDAYEAFLCHLPVEDRENPLQGYYRLLTSDDRRTRVDAAKSWNTWDATIGSLQPGPDSFSRIDDDDWSLSHARLEAHYFVHGAWLEDGQLLKPQNLARISHLPLTIIQGRYDIICPPRTAWELHKKWPGSKIFLIPGVGHNASEPGIHEKLIEAANEDDVAMRWIRQLRG